MFRESHLTHSENLAIRIRVCLHACRKSLEMRSALAAGVRGSPADAEALAPLLARCFSRFLDTQAAALIEFAVALPLLVVLVVGIFDFGGAFNLKQELSNAAREGARFAASQPTNDISLTNQKPPSVDAIRFLVDSYLQTAKINDCGLGAIPEPPQSGSLVWTYNASSGCPAALTLIISRQAVIQETINGATTQMLCTTVQISYPYQWHFNSVIQLLVPGATYAGISQIPGDATAVNMD